MDNPKTETNYLKLNAIKKPSTNIIESALVSALGNLTVAANSLQVTRKTLYQWIEDEGLESCVEEARDGALDHVENKLMDRINDEDTTAIIFFLKTQGRNRGYGDKQEINHSHNSNELNVIVKNMSK